MKHTIWTQKYNVNTFLVNPQKKLGLFGLLNLIQDTAWIHATHLGHGYESMNKDQLAWVLIRQKLVMNNWPSWGEDIELRTWIRPINQLLAIRDFEILLDGEKIGECSTQWLILDLKTRKPAEQNLELSGDECRQDAPAFLDAAKIPLMKNLKSITEFRVRNSDLDLNGHVNNTRYAQWILDSIPHPKHQAYFLEEYEVNFIAETHSNDLITITGSEMVDEKIQFQGIRAHDNKIVFAATLKVKRFI